MLLSGGPDSTLLALLAAEETVQRGWPFRILHVNHGFRGPESDAEEAWVRRLCAAHGWPLEVLVLPAGVSRGNRAAWARRQRRSFALDNTPADSALLTAHHADDQRESVLMALLLGKLPWGLAGMPAVDGRWVKPLLEWGRVEILAELQRRGQDWCQDSSNLRRTGWRNRVRLELVPRLERAAPGAWQAVVDAIARDARILESRCLQEMQNLLEMQDLRTEPWGLSLVRQGWDRYHGAAVRKALEALGRRLGAWQRSPSAGRLDSLSSFVVSGRAGAFLPMGRGVELSLARDRVHLHSGLESPAVLDLPPHSRVQAGADCWVRGAASTGPSSGGFLLGAEVAGRALQIRVAAPGDRLRLGTAARKSLGSLLAEAGWSRPERKLRLLLADGSNILWIPGLRRAWQPGDMPPQQAPEMVWVER